mmetsp:Transcript_70858/g.189086  ORF Transcript_70858/g.189086 Transcript_70858/m.189086 type:complete len:115 (-) Transcript_70858:98-442(-)
MLSAITRSLAAVTAPAAGVVLAPAFQHGAVDQDIPESWGFFGDYRDWDLGPSPTEVWAQDPDDPDVSLVQEQRMKKRILAEAGREIKDDCEETVLLQTGDTVRLEDQEESTSTK